MITLPNSLEKTQELTFILAKEQLLSLVSDAYWSVSLNIARVYITYGSKEGNQKKTLIFEFSESAPSAKASWSERSRDEFEIKSITFIGHNDDTYNLPTNLIPTGKDVDFVVILAETFRPDADLTAMETDGTNIYVAGHNMTRMQVASDYMSEFNLATGANTATDFYSRFPVFNSTVRTFCFTDPNTLWVGGDFTTMNGRTRNRIAKLVRTNGAWVPDAMLTTNSTNFGFTGAIHRIVTDGSFIFVMGQFITYTAPNGTNTSRPHIVKLALDGTLQSFNAGNAGIITNNVVAAVIANDSIYISGKNTANSAIFGYNVTRHNLDTGALVNGWPNVAIVTSAAASPGVQVYDLKIRNGYLYIGGSFGGGAGFNVGGTPTGSGAGAAISGGTTYSTHFNLVRIDALTGAMDASFNASYSSFSATSYVRSIDFDSSGALVVAGQWKGTGSITQNMARLNASTGAMIAGDAAPNATGSGRARDLGLLGSVTDPRWTSQAAVANDAFSFTVENGVMALTYSTTIVRQSNTEGSGYYEIPLPAGYDFDPSVTRATTLGTGTISSGLGTSFGTGSLNGNATTIRPGPRGMLVHLTASAGYFGDGRVGVAQFQAGQATTYAFSFTASIPVVKRFNPSDHIRKSLAAIRGVIPVGDELIVVGTMRSPLTKTGLVSGYKAFGALRLNKYGEPVASFLANQEAPLTAQADIYETGIVDGNRLLVGGNQTYSHAYVSPAIVKFTKDAKGFWRVNPAFVAPAFNAEIRTMLHDSGKLYIGGSFTTVGGIARNRIAAVDATTGALDGFGFGVFTAGVTTGQFNGVGNSVNRIKRDGAHLVIAGLFGTYSVKTGASSFSNTSCSFWIRVDPATNTPQAVPTGPNNEIKDFTVVGSDLYAVGSFTQWGSTARQSIAKVNAATGVLDTTFVPPALANPAYSGSALIIGNGVELIGDKLFIVTNATTVAGVTSRSGTFTANPSTGAIVRSYTQIECPILVQSSISVDNDYIYICGWNDITSLSQPNLSSLYRINKTSFDVSNNWGYRQTGVVFSPRGIELIGDEIILGAAALSSNTVGFPSELNPHTKRLYSLQKATAIRKHTI